MPTKYDLAIIGSGGGAFAAAIRASTLGKSVVMIERGTLGGTCATVTIPSREASCMVSRPIMSCTFSTRIREPRGNTMQWFCTIWCTMTPVAGSAAICSGTRRPSGATATTS